MSLPKSKMGVRQIVIATRRNGASLSQVYLILALLEINACDTPFFVGMDNEDLIVSLLTLVKIKQEEFWQKYILTGDYDDNDFPGFLSGANELEFDPLKLKEVVEGISDKGEENYEFTRIDRMDKTGTEQGRVEKVSPQGSQNKSPA